MGTEKPGCTTSSTLKETMHIFSWFPLPTTCTDVATGYNRLQHTMVAMKVFHSSKVCLAVQIENSCHSGRCNQATECRFVWGTSGHGGSKKHYYFKTKYQNQRNGSESLHKMVPFTFACGMDAELPQMHASNIGFLTNVITFTAYPQCFSFIHCWYLLCIWECE